MNSEGQQLNWILCKITRIKGIQYKCTLSLQCKKIKNTLYIIVELTDFVTACGKV